MVAFLAAVAVGPLALALAAVRAAPASAEGVLRAAGTTEVALPALAAAASVAVVLLVELVVDAVKLRRVKRAAKRLGSVAVRQAAIGTSPTVATPTAIGYAHPAVLLPEDFRARVDDLEWDAVVAHECAHLARFDDWAKAAQSAAQRIGWWLPGLWILGRALDLERELASDEHAACGAGARRYAACLLRLASSRGGSPLAASFGGRRSHVAIRVERLLRPTAGAGPLARAATLGAFTAAALAVIAMAVLAVPGTAERAAAPAARVASAPHRAPARPARMVARSVRLVHPRAPRVALVKPESAVSSSVAPAPAPPAVLSRPVRHAAPARAARRAEPRRTTVAATPVIEIAFVAPARRCTTCVGPQRSPDGGVSSEPARPPQPAGGGGAGAAAAVGADDPTSGPVTLNAPMLWARMPIRVLQMP